MLIYFSPTILASSLSLLKPISIGSNPPPKGSPFISFGSGVITTMHSEAPSSSYTDLTSCLDHCLSFAIDGVTTVAAFSDEESSGGLQCACLTDEEGQQINYDVGNDAEGLRHIYAANDWPFAFEEVGIVSDEVEEGNGYGAMEGCMYLACKNSNYFALRRSDGSCRCFDDLRVVTPDVYARKRPIVRKSS
ncbi:hypothetical protein BDY24DRAFT_417609 [Mrakia frigida]|uniref:uncharacterized protein n=1 Tax=Mrakia frigida TaxID=29902 RepID=UPI003FCC0259